MKPPASSPLFLQRRSYRQRRMMDAMRLLPILGVLLWVLPLFWPSASDPAGGPAPVSMSAAVIYVFGVWAFLIAASFVLRLILRPTWRQQAADPDEAGGDESG